MKKDIFKLKKKDRLTTFVHLADGVVNNAKHANSHIKSVGKAKKNKVSKKFNQEHAEKHSKETLDHAKKLVEHIKKYPSLDALEKELEGKSF